MRRIAKITSIVSFNLIVMVVASQAARAGGLNIDFGSQFLAPSSVFGASSGNAGFWNDITSLGASSGLKDLSAATTGVTIDVTAETMGGFSGTSATNDVSRLLNDNFYSFPQQQWRITLTGLADGVYDVYAYAPANINASTGDFSVNGIPVTSFPGASTLIEGVSWKRITNVNIVSGSMTLAGMSTTDFSGLSGLQLVPEPSAAITWTLTSIIVAAGRLMRRSRALSRTPAKMA